VDTWLVESANLELVQSIYAAWERGDLGSAEWAHPQIEFVIDGGPTPGTWTGLAGMAAAMRELLSAWRELSVEVEEYRELDGERVLVFHEYVARGKTSGLELGKMRAEAAGLFELHGGMVTRLVFYFDRAEALADVVPVDM